jgi:predicted fused transcriptional regulator/phosphomethylpyrimidine kinase/predicted transcriptional regulator
MMAEKFLPAMRVVVARRLHSEGFSQSRIAGLLGITQASVSLYLAQGQVSHTRYLSELGVSAEEADRYSSLLSEDLKKNPIYAVSTLYSIWSDLLGKGALCAAHRGEYPFLAQCEMCMRTFGVNQTQNSEAIDMVIRAVEMIETSSIFVHIMPEVSVNVAYAQGEAAGVNDVVAVPGRIVRVRDRAMSLMRPEFGASTHLAKILLEARTRMKEYRAAMNLRYDEKIEKLLGPLGLRSLVIGGKYSKAALDPVVEALSRQLKESSAPFDVIVDLGGSRIEPSLYLLASNPVDVAGLALRIARLYSMGPETTDQAC